MMTMHAGVLRILNDARNYWGMAQAFATQKNILKRIRWADMPKSYAEWVVENRKLQIRSSRMSRSTAIAGTV